MAENATKCSAADGLTQTFDFCNGTPLMVRAVDFNALHAECLRLRKDAERYRWLRECHGSASAGQLEEVADKGWERVNWLYDEDLDTLIDAEMAAAPAIGAA